MLANLAMTPKQWSGFVKASPLNGDWFEDDDRYLRSVNDSWWDPEAPSSLPTQQARLPNAEFLNVGVNRREPGKLIVYMMWRGT